jgi:hypothetical protein
MVLRTRCGPNFWNFLDIPALLILLSKSEKCGRKFRPSLSN